MLLADDDDDDDGRKDNLISEADQQQEVGQAGRPGRYVPALCGNQSPKPAECVFGIQLRPAWLAASLVGLLVG